MKIQKVIFTVFGIFGVSLGGGLTVSDPAQASTAHRSDGLSEEEACLEALNKNSIKALEAFLKKYPPGRSNSTCSALAMTAKDKLGGNEAKSDGPRGGGVYSSGR